MNVRDLNLTTLSDEELVHFAQMGRQDAFTALYERFLPSVYARVRFKIPEPEVEDVTQEVFIAILKSLNSFRGGSKFSTWVRTIINRKIVDFYRASGSNTLETDDYDDVKLHNLVDHRETSNQQDNLLNVQHALSKLPQNYQEILLMRFVEEMPFNEIARQNGQSLEATKSLFRRSVAALAQKLEDGNG
jgi:RNA polymerase sigma-70 factor (ECF subfamily)